MILGVKAAKLISSTWPTGSGDVVARPSRTSTQHKHMLSPIRSNLKVSYSGGVPMSAFGTKRTLGDRVPKSAFGGKADMTRMSAFDPKRTLAVRFCCDAQRPNSLYWDMFRTREDAQCPFQYVRHKQSTLLTVDVPSMRSSRRSQPSKTAPYTVCGTVCHVPDCLWWNRFSPACTPDGNINRYA